jgi:signal transduction histidine kinase
LTAKSQLEDRLSARQAGADVYLSKPFSPHELRAAIAQQVARRGRQAGTFLKANLRSLEVVSAGLAHEINNPLGENLDMSAEVRTELTATRIQIDRMSATIALGLKKIERIVTLMRRYAQEGYSHAPLPVDLDAAIRDLVELVAPRGDKRVTVQTALQASGAQVVCIAEELHQAISGLVQNAVDAVGEGGLVTVRSRVSGGSAVVEVEDDGPGIEPDHLAQIFTPFFTTKPPGAGMGLGLCITQRVIEDAGGTIDVVSAPGEGTMFRVTLPVHAESGIQALERPGVVAERRHADSRGA